MLIKLLKGNQYFHDNEHRDQRSSKEKKKIMIVLNIVYKL